MALNFQIKLDDQVSPGANKAASSLQKLEAAIKQEGTSIRSLETQMRTLEKGGQKNLDIYKQISAQLASQRGRVADLTAEMVKQGGAGFTGATEKAKGLSGIMSELTSEGGALGEVMATLGPYGAAAAAGFALMGGAMLGVSAAVVYLESKLVSLGIAASESKGDITRSLELLYGGEKAADHTYKVLESLTGSIAISQGRVMELADSLIQAGQVNGDAMVKSIAAIGKAEAARAGAGKVLEGVITRATSARIFSISRAELRQVGLSYKDLSTEIAKGLGTTAADAELRLRTGGVAVKAGLDALGKVVDAKLGDLASKKFQTVGAQTQRLHDLFGRLFEGVDSGPFARLLMVIANTLEESTVTGAALRTVVKSAFDEISSAAERVAPYLQAFFEGGILLALKLYNALYPVRQAIAKMFGGSDAGGLASFEDKTIAFADSLATGFSVAAKGVAFLINNIKQLGEVASTLVHITPFAGAALDLAKLDIDILTGKFNKSKDKATQAGANTAAGVAAGITAGTPQVEAAMAAMATKSLKSFDDKMQIHSPSKVMQLRGKFINEGLAKGQNDNADIPAKSLAKVGAGVATAPVGGRSSSAGGGVVVHVTFAPGAVVVGGLAAAEDQLTEMFSNVMQRAAAMQGA